MTSFHNTGRAHPIPRLLGSGFVPSCGKLQAELSDSWCLREFLQDCRCFGIHRVNHARLGSWDRIILNNRVPQLESRVIHKLDSISVRP